MSPFLTGGHGPPGTSFTLLVSPSKLWRCRQTMSSHAALKARPSLSGRHYRVDVKKTKQDNSANEAPKPPERRTIANNLNLYGKAENPDSQLPGVQIASARNGRDNPGLRRI